jgi:hypothetical protein
MGLPSSSRPACTILKMEMDSEEFKISDKFTYIPESEMIICHFTPTDLTKFYGWCSENDLRYITWLGKQPEVHGVTAELFVLFKMTWD